MAWYYGVNDSELYGSNFSTVLADAPPPLDDTFDEDDNEIVFPNEVRKLKKFNGETASASSKKIHSSDENFSDKSKYDGSRAPESQGSVEEDSDFGGFAGFADFGSAFGQENSGESPDWFSGDGNNVNSPPAVKTATSNQNADFAAFPENGGSLNQEKITNGGFKQENSSISDNKEEYYNSENRYNSINGSYDLDSDDDFGDFASVDKSSGRSEEVSTECETKTVEIQPDLERECASTGRTYCESDIKSDRLDAKSETKIAQCNGDTADKEVFSHCEESAVKHTSEGFTNVNKGQDNEFGTKRDTSNVANVSKSLTRDEESRPLGKTFEAVQHEEYHTGESVLTEPEREDDKLKNDVVGEISSSNKGKESLENTKTSPEDKELNDDGFGEFADFTGPTVKQPSIDDDDDEDEEDELCNEQMPHSPVISVSTSDGKEDSSCMQIASAQNKGDDEFGDFGSFDEEHDQNYESTTDVIVVDSRTECVSTQNDDHDDDEFGEFGSSNNAENTCPPEAQNSGDFGDFGTFKSDTKDSQNVSDGKDESNDFDISNSKGKTVPNEDESANDFGDFGAFNSMTKDSNNEDDDGFGDFGTSGSGEKTLPREDQDNDDFGDFGTFNSRTRDSPNKDDDSFGDFGTSNSGDKSLPKGDQDSDDFSNFGAFDSSMKESQKDSDMDNDFGDFGSFESNTKKDENNSDDFGSFESNTKDDQSGDPSSDRFVDFGAFDAQAKDLSDKNKSDNEFGNFGSFESSVKDLPKGKQSSSNVKDFHASELKDDSKFGDFRTSAPQETQKKKNLQSEDFDASSSVSKTMNNSKESKDDFGDFSSGEGKESSFATCATSCSESATSPRKNKDLKQRETSTSYFVPGNNVIIKQVEDTFSPCFISEQRHISHCQCDVLSSRIEQTLKSNLGLWQQLERCDKEGRILFHWSNSFSKHKKLLSLTIRPDRPPPLQGGTMLKPTVSSQFTPFGGGLPGSMLMPKPYSKLPHSPSGLTNSGIKGFLEPVKGSHLPAQSSSQDKMSSHQSAHPTHPEIGLPDLSFVLGNGLKPTASKSDIRDNVSDTTSESSSLDLDFFAPNTTQPSEGKPESRGLYEEDLLGLNIISSSLEAQKSDSPKPQKTSDTKKVWQHGGVTIPLSSNESKAQLSAAAKSILDELEDLRFMSSSVLMFPLKS